LDINLTAMDAAAQKKSNFRRRAGTQNYERHLANSHSALAVVGLIFILITCVVDGGSLSCSLAPDSDVCGCVKEINFLAPRSYRADDEAQGYERYLVNSHSPHRRRCFDFSSGHQCAVEEVPLLPVSLPTAMGVAVYNISIPDAGGSQPFIGESSGGDTPAPSHEEENAETFS